MKWAVEWPEPRTLEARITCTRKCDDDLGWSSSGVEVLVDSMDDSFCHSLAAWPAGGYVLGADRQLLYVCSPSRNEVFFDEEELFSFLRERAHSMSN